MKTDDRLYREMISYLIDQEKHKEYCESPQSADDAPSRSPYELLENRADKSFDEMMDEMIGILMTTPYLDKDRLHQYEKVKAVSHKEGQPDAADIFGFLFDLSDAQVMSWPAYGILYDRFGEIMASALDGFAPCDLSDRVQANKLRDRVYALLSEYILKELSPEQLHTYSGDEDDDLPSDGPVCEVEDGSICEDYLYSECCVTHLDKADFDRKRNVGYIAAFGSDDVNRESTLIENMMTYIDKTNPSQAVTYQIIGRERYPSCREMVDALGSEAFGFSTSSVDGIETALTVLGKYIGDPSMGMLALKVRKLPYPIFNPEDIIKNREV